MTTRETTARITELTPQFGVVPWVNCVATEFSYLVVQRFRNRRSWVRIPSSAFYNKSPHESSAEASRHTRLELSPSTTTITSLPGRVPLAIKHLPAASV